MHVLATGKRQVLSGLLNKVALHRQVFIGCHRGVTIALYLMMHIALHPLLPAMPHAHIQISFCTQEELLLTFAILDAQFVKAIAPLRRAGFNTTAGFLRR